MVTARMKRLQELLKETASQCLILVPGVDLFYATGLNIHASERLTALVLPAEGKPVVLCPSFEKSRIEKIFTHGTIRTWEEDEDPFKLLAKIIAELGAEAGKISMDNKLWFEWFLRIKKELPKVEFSDASKVVQIARLIKTEEEIAIMRKASEIAATAIINTFKQVEPGMNETEIAAIVRKELAKEGTPAFALVQSGANSSFPHGAPTGRTIEKNDVLLIDAGPIYEGYFGDVTITSVIGEPSDKFLEIYDIVYNANRAAFAASKEGAIAEEVDKAARDFITEKGYGKYFTHRLGHGIGIEGHERPYIVKGNKLVLQAGMCHTIEPGIYIEGSFGVRIEDDVVVRKDGCEFLYEVPRRIWELL
ncbi:MAG: Xaa-Pro peptidase family protein [Candidatus Heimdallarchaeota archaeon]|nr:Xaa-Pro peptidase family protein [Candidatus Heimdallarchaeota archaeon]